MRKFLRLLFVVWVAMLPVRAQQGQTTTLNNRTWVYATPYQEIIGELPSQTSIQMLGRTDTAHWVQVSGGGVTGWVAAGNLSLGQTVRLIDLPVTMTQPAPTLLPLTDDPELQTLAARVISIPILYNLQTDVVRNTFERGQTLGNRPDVFTRVGDSDTTSGGFLRPIGMDGGRYCELGAYSYLQDSIEFFNLPPRDGLPNSFNATSIAAVNGMTSATVFDPVWAAPAMCEPDEAPLLCEYRLVRPAVAIIDLGLMDIQYYSEAEYRTNMERVVQVSLEQGVIPILTTFVVLPTLPPGGRLDWETSMTFNNTLIEIAEAYQIPLINLWAAAQPLPNYGIGADNTHLRHVVGEFCDFNGPEQRNGGTLRNLLTLQALDELRRFVLING